MKQTCLTGTETGQDAVIFSINEADSIDVEATLRVLVRSFKLTGFAFSHYEVDNERF